MKSAKQLIDALVDAVQEFDGRVGCGGYGPHVSEFEQAYRKARRELHDALLSARKKQKVKHESTT